LFLIFLGDFNLFTCTPLLLQLQILFFIHFINFLLLILFILLLYYIILIIILTVWNIFIILDLFFRFFNLLAILLLFLLFNLLICYLLIWLVNLWGPKDRIKINTQRVVLHNRLSWIAFTSGTTSCWVGHNLLAVVKLLETLRIAFIDLQW